MTMTRRNRRRGVAMGILMVFASATLALSAVQPAAAAGDVCDLCSLNFDLGACQGLGGYPYDSTQEDPPPALGGGGPVDPKPAPPAPAAPAPAAPAPAPAPAAPAPVPAPAPGGSGGSSNGGSRAERGTESGGDTAQQPPAVGAVVTAPLAPPTPTVTATGRSLTISWSVPADGGSPITGYKVVLNGGAPIAVPAASTSYTIDVLAAGSYTASVVATNTAGDSPASPVSAAARIAKSAASAASGAIDVDGELRPGGTITITGENFTPDQKGLTVEIRSTPVRLATVSSQADGSFTLSATIPDSIEPGEHTLVVLSDGSEVATQKIIVEAASGWDAAPFSGVIILVALVAAGGLALLAHSIVRRRRGVATAASSEVPPQ